MTHRDYVQWKDDPRVGKCPFCDEPGWIIGDDAWCSHYLGSKDDLESGLPELGSLEAVPALENLLEIVDSISNEITVSNIVELPGLDSDCRNVLKLLVNYGDRFWCHLIPTQTLSSEVSSGLCDTSFTSYFTPNPDKSINALEKAVKGAIEVLKAHPFLSDHAGGGGPEVPFSD